MKIHYLASLGIIFSLISTASFAGACSLEGKRVQTVNVSIAGSEIDDWDVVGDDIHTLRLPNGYKLGVRVEPTSYEKYKEMIARSGKAAYDELVKLSIFDMNSEKPKMLSYSWVGTNSRQSNPVPVVTGSDLSNSSKRMDFWLHKSICMRLSDIQPTR